MTDETISTPEEDPVDDPDYASDPVDPEEEQEAEADG